MKRFAASILFTLAMIIRVGAQSPDARDQQQLANLIRDLQAQQAQIADNQTKIEAKMAELIETMRVARLFAGKAGK